ncbi:MAG: hypothetical protein QM763_21020 [Agriterribacter sp.]
MKRIFLSLLFVFILTRGIAQPTQRRNLMLKLDPLALINPITFPTVQFSLEKEFAHRFSIAPEIGVQMYRVKSFVQDTSLIKPTGFKIGLEGRYYGLFKESIKYKHHKAMPTVEKYISLHVFYRENKYNTQLNYVKLDDATYHTDCFVTNKKAFGANLIFGIQLRSKGRILFEFYGGVGMLNRRTKNHSREYNSQKDELDTKSYVINFLDIGVNSSLQENNGTFGNVILGIRVGVKL